MKRIRGGSGLGDSLYVRGVVELIGKKVVVCTNHPELFSDLDVETDVFSRHNIQILAHYSKRKEENTNQWEDVCIQARIEPRPLRFSWKGPERDDTVLIAAPRFPMGRNDGFGREILPERDAFVRACEAVKGCRLLIGEKPVYDVPHDIDLTGKTSLKDLMNLAYSCSGMIGQCSFIIPLAEGFNKPLLVVWSHKIHQAESFYVRRILPWKILSNEKSLYIYDDEDDPETISEFCRLVERERKAQGISGDSRLRAVVS